MSDVPSDAPAGGRGGDRAGGAQRRPTEDPTLAAPGGAARVLRAAGIDPGVDLDPDEPRGAAAAAGPPAASPSGRYDVRGEIGRGGMGAVLEVRDRDLRRRLAMKVLLAQAGGRPAAAGDVPPDLLARFLEEAQVTAQLQHPGVVPVHELGVDADGRVFFTMDLVRGRTLSEVFDLARAGREGWSTTRAVQTLLRVCETLAFAHERGVIHRDVKPANVMVGRHGEVYVMDWGLAKVRGLEPSHDIRLRGVDPSSLSRIRTARGDTPAGAESPLVTMDGAVVGTPAYMSPEQAAGRVEIVDQRSDVYAVGAMLYELLTGGPPYVEPGERLSPHMVLARVWAGPPRPAHEVAPGVPPELEAIADRAMARDRDARYRDAADLAEDLQRYVTGHVVRAHRGGALVELRKWVARNRAAAATAGVAAAVLAAATAVYVVRVSEARSEADLQRAAAERSAAAARDARAQAEGLVSFMLNDLRGRLEGLDRVHLLADVADRARAYHDAVPADAGDDAGLAQRATGHRAVAQVLAIQGRHDDALASWRAASGIAEELVRRHPQDAGHAAAAAWDASAIEGSLRWRGSVAEADVWLERALDRALRARELAPGSEAGATVAAYVERNVSARTAPRGEAAVAAARRVCEALERRIAADPSNVGLRAALVEAEVVLSGEPPVAGHDPAEAARRALDRARSLVADAPASDAARFALGQAWNRWFDIVLRGDAPAPALEAAVEARKILEELVAKDPENLHWTMQLWRARSNLANVHHWLPDVREEVDAARSALDLAERISARSPALAARSDHVAVSHELLAAALTRARRPDEALPHSLAGLEPRQRAVRERPTDAAALRTLVAAEQAVALALVGLRRAAEGKEHALAAVAAAERLLALDPPVADARAVLVQACHPAAFACTLNREFAEAVTHRRRAVEMHDPPPGPDASRDWLHRMLRCAEILAGLRQPETPWDFADSAEQLDRFLGEDAAALPWYEKALADEEVRRHYGKWRLWAIGCALRVAQASKASDAAEAERARNLARAWLRDEVRTTVRARRRAAEALAAATTDAERRLHEGGVEKVRSILHTLHDVMPELAPWRGTAEFEAVFDDAERELMK